MNVVSEEPAVAGDVVRHPRDGWIMADVYPMSGYTRRALAGIVRAICPPPPAPQIADLEERVATQVGRMLRYMNPMVAFGFCAAVVVLDLAPVWRLVALRRVQSIDPARGAAVLGPIGTSKVHWLRLLMLGVRGLVLSVYFDQDEVHRAMDYAPVPFITQRIDLRKRLRAGAVEGPGDRIDHRSSLENRGTR